MDSGKKSEARHTASTQTTTTKEGEINTTLWHLPVELGHLSESQREVMQKMLYEESGVFSKGDDDIVCIPFFTFHMDLPSSSGMLAKNYVTLSLISMESVSQKTTDNFFFFFFKSMFIGSFHYYSRLCHKTHIHFANNC